MTMFGLITIKKLNNILKESFKLVKQDNEKRDSKVSNSLNKIETKTDTNSKEIAELKGIIKVLMINSQVSVSKSVSKSPKVSQSIETKAVNRIRRSKKALICAKIEELQDSYSVVEMYDIIVLEKGLCSKASYYRYIQSLKSPIKTKLRHK